jgi:SHS2 domain-containing protein
MIQEYSMTANEKFRYLEHTADAKFQAFGATLEEAFANAALAVASLMWEPAQVSASQKEAVRVGGNDLQQLLMAFLEEILYLLETREFLLHEAEEVRISVGQLGYELEAVFVGDTGTGRHEIFGDVKAVTYNDMKIETSDAPMIQVVVDM